MNKTVLIAAGAVVGAALYVSRNHANNLGAGVTDAAHSAAQEAAEFIDSFTGGSMKLSAMAQVTQAMVVHPNMQAFLKVIRRGEGTSGVNGYRTLFGGGLFEGFADHPRTVVRRSGYASSAAGAYQFLTSTWDETRRLMRLPDFSPKSQDFGAVGRIAARGALADVLAGRFEIAIKKVAKEWASMPGSPYGQPVISMQTALAVYQHNGGNVA